jgi:inosine/xanthosine triphosphate pyrophosphatase family protein/dephospho-CoA kinase
MIVNPARADLREIFLSQERRVDIFFYTSNLVKFLHAHTVFERFGIPLNHFRSKSDPYSEDYSGTKEHLLARAIDEIKGSIGSGSLFFVEDTSVKIDALSSPELEFPGLTVKEWFTHTSFQELDTTLRQLDRGRTATVHSSIALHVPRLPTPIYFEGSTSGTVATVAPGFSENVQYPWLTPHSFNGWFIPDGSTKTLGEMTFEESWYHDFRTRTLVQLIDRLEEYQAILNLPPHAYTRLVESQRPDQASLFQTDERQIFIVVGYTCAGKTTFGDYASTRHDFRFIEASSVLRTLKGNGHHELDPFSFAQNVLEANGPEAVAIKIIQLCSREKQRGLVISGFRTIEEVELMKQHYPDCKLIWVEATEKTRFARYLARARDVGVSSLQEFRELDAQQSSFGLLRVAEDFADIRLINEDSLETYDKQIDAILSGRKLKGIAGIATDTRPRHSAAHNQLYECLAVLSEATRPLTCDEIQERSKARGHEIRYNNANKVLRRAPGLVKRWKMPGSNLRYEILNSGRAYLRLMREVDSTPEPKRRSPTRKRVQSRGAVANQS